MTTVIYNQTGKTLFKSKSYLHNILLKKEIFCVVLLQL